MPVMLTRAHGNVVVPQFPSRLLQVDGGPWTDVQGLPVGWGKVFRCVGGLSENWFHIPIPSVSQIDASPMFLDQVYVFFEAERSPSGAGFGGVKRVDVWDGSARIAYMPAAFLMTGNWSGPREEWAGVSRAANTWMPRWQTSDGRWLRHRIYTGLCLSVNTQFIQDGKITFFSAGASLVDRPD